MGSRKKAGKKPPAKTNSENDKHEIFVRAYLIAFNASQAAIAAGYSAKGAEVTGSRLLRNPKVQERIKTLSQKRVDKLEITGEKILQELAKVAFSNIAQFADWSGSGWNWKPSDVLSELDKSAIQEISETVTKEGGSTKLKLYDKIRALELLGRWREMGLWKDSVEITKPKGEKSEEFTKLMGEVRKLFGAVRAERGK